MDEIIAKALCINRAERYQTAIEMLADLERWKPRRALLEHRKLDIRSDFYSLGATIYFMLTGQPPYSGSLARISSQHLEAPVPDEPLKDLPRSIVSLVKRLMAKDPNELIPPFVSGMRKLARRFDNSRRLRQECPAWRFRQTDKGLSVPSETNCFCGRQ